MTTAFTTTLLPLVYNPGLTPSGDGLPPGFLTWLRSIGGGVFAVAFIVFAIALVVSVIVWAVSTFATQNQRYSSVGAKGILICLVCAAVAGGANRLIAWAGRSGEGAITGAPELTGQAVTLLRALGA